MLGRKDGDLLQFRQNLARQEIETADALHLVAEETDAVAPVLVGGMDFQHVAAHAETPACQRGVVPLVIDADQMAQHRLAPHARAFRQRAYGVAVVFRVAQPVDAGHGSHDHHVRPRKQGAGGGQAQAFDLVIDLGVFFDERIRLGNVRFGLVIVVVTDEVLHGVVRQEFLQFAVELGGQRLVVRQHERRRLPLGDDVGHGESLAGARNAQQYLMREALFQALRQRLNRVRLIARRPKGADHLEARVLCRRNHKQQPCSVMP